MTANLFLLFTLLSANEPSPTVEARQLSEEECKLLTDVAQTRPKPADLKEMDRDLLGLKNLRGETIIKALGPELKASVHELFSRPADKVSKLEQFYGLLYYIGRHKSLEGKRHDFDPQSVRKLLLSSKTFSTPAIPESITSVTLFWNKAHDIANYVVKFREPLVKLPLNDGRGFPSFKQGLCQVAEELHFYGGFEFEVKKTSGNIYVYNFKDVDLFGRFGSRGIVDVDINYVSVKSVEFLKGSPYGIVRAKVSRKEFDVNEHSTLLRIVTKFVTDKSTQPIDW